MQTITAGVQPAIFKGVSPIITAYKRRASSLPVYTSTIPVETNYAAVHAVKTTDYLVRFRFYGTAYQCVSIPNASIPTDWTGLTWVNIVTGADPNKVQVFKKGTKLVVLWYVSDGRVDYRVSGDQGLTWAAAQTWASAGGGPPAAIDEYGFAQESGGADRYYVFSFNTGTLLFSLAHTHIHSLTPSGGYICAVEYAGAIYIFCPTYARLFTNEGGSWYTTGTALHSDGAPVNIALVNSEYWFYFTTGRSYVSADLIHFQAAIEAGITGMICHYLSGSYYSVNGEKFAPDLTETLLPVVMKYKYNISKITITFATEPSFDNSSCLVLYRGVTVGEMISCQPFYSPRYTNAERTEVTAYTLPYVPYLIIPPGALLASVFYNAFGFASLDFPVMDASVPAYLLTNTALEFKSNQFLSNLIPQYVEQFFLHYAPRASEVRILSPETAVTADLTLEYFKYETLVQSILRFVTIHSIDGSGTVGYNDISIDVTGYSSRIHSLGDFDSALLATAKTKAIHWYSHLTSPRKLLYCQPHLALEIGDTVEWDTSMGFVLDIEENFTPGHSPGWWQEILVSDISATVAPTDYFLLLENAGFFLLESADKLILG